MAGRYDKESLTRFIVTFAKRNFFRHLSSQFGNDEESTGCRHEIRDRRASRWDHIDIN